MQLKTNYSLFEALLFRAERFTNNLVVVFRTRDKEKIRKSDIVIDVGEEYDGKTKFDHHQFEVSDEHPFSSAGLIWKFINKKKEHRSISKLVREVDENDTGIKKQEQFHYCGIIFTFQASDINSYEQEEKFNEAIEFSLMLLKNLKRKDEEMKEKALLAKELEVQIIHEMKVVIVPKNKEYIPISFFRKKADLSIQWDKKEKIWKIQTIPIKPGNFESKYKLQVTSNENEIFTHKAGFISKVKEANEKIIFSINNKLIEIDLSIY